MTIELVTDAERRAQEASRLPAFSGMDVLHVKRQLGLLLDLIGTGSIFDEYTLHNLTHIEAMLSLTNWLIPTESREHMSSADWMMLVLAVYFHDLGMLVTKDEYRSRNSSYFPQFKDEKLFTR